MCGIFGIVGSREAIMNRALLQRMGGSIHHRGPDHAGLHLDAGAALGINRLAIIDPAGGNQPIFNEDGSLVIVYNGELYNHRALRNQLKACGHIFHTNTDTEVVLHAFEEYGQACLDRFNGMFAMAIWNRRCRRLFLARDRLGIKPLYLLDLPDGLAFASEAKTLLPLLPNGARPNWTAINRFLSFGYFASPDSPFEGIRKLPAGHWAWFEDERLTTRQYWSPSYGQGREFSFEEAGRCLNSLLNEAVQSELMSDVDVGVFLSGGLDSSAVAAFAQRHCRQRLQSFALRFAETTHDESADARRVAEHLGLEHHECSFGEDDLRNMLWETAAVLDEPFGDSTVVPLLALSRFARQRVRVVLTGWGGDELFAGYPTYKAHRLAHAYRHMPKAVSQYLIPAIVRRLPVSDRYMSLEFKAKRFVRDMDAPPELQHFSWMGYFDEPGKQRLLTGDVLGRIDGPALEPVIKRLADLPEKDIVDRIMHLDALFFLEGNGLFQADRMTMAASIEARVPLLNHTLLSFVSALPIGVKMHDGRLKELLRQTVAPYLPAEILNKPKKGFGPPSATWLRGPLAGVLDEVFARDKVEDQGVFNYAEIRRLIDQHRRRRADHGRNLWAMLSLQLWYDQWIEGGRSDCADTSAEMANAEASPA